MDQPEPYTYTDASDDTLTIDRISNVVTLEARQGDQAAGIHVLFEDVEQVVAALRTAAGAQQPAPEKRRDRYANAISISGGDYDAADAVMTVADEEQRELIARLGQYADRGIANGQEADRLRAELEQARGCICGHPEQQHFEDVCLTCGCGDYLPVDAAAEEIARLRQIVRQARGTTGQDTTPADGEQETRLLIAEGLHSRGAYCGECNFDDDSKTCPDCLRVRGWYVDAVLPVVRAAVAAAVRRALEAVADDWAAHCPDHSASTEASMSCRCDDANELRGRADALWTSTSEPDEHTA